MVYCHHNMGIQGLAFLLCGVCCSFEGLSLGVFLPLWDSGGRVAKKYTHDCLEIRILSAFLFHQHAAVQWQKVQNRVEISKIKWNALDAERLFLWVMWRPGRSRATKPPPLLDTCHKVAVGFQQNGENVRQRRSQCGTSLRNAWKQAHHHT